MTPKITLEQATAILDNLTGAKIISFVAETDARLRKYSSGKSEAALKCPSDSVKNSGSLSPFHGDRSRGRIANPFGVVYKRAKVNALVNFWYDAAVLRRLEKEGKDDSVFRKGESWHEPVLTADGKLTPFARHKQTGDLYLRVVRLGTCGEPEYRTAAGEVVDVGLLEPFLDSKPGYQNQGADDPVIFQTFRLDGIKEITVDGVVYTLAS